jgi:hypothetical protein
MKYHTWSFEKNEWLKATRALCFEDVVKYPGQKIYVLALKDYVHLVPFVEDAETVFLKTVIPSRQAHAAYLKKATP